jgi:hypothetical protein
VIVQPNTAHRRNHADPYYQKKLFPFHSDIHLFYRVQITCPDLQNNKLSVGLVRGGCQFNISLFRKARVLTPSA